MTRKAKLPEYWIPQDLKTILLSMDRAPDDQKTEKSERFLSVIKKLKDIRHLELDECHYLQFLKLGLYLEEFQHSIDQRKYNIYGTKIQRARFGLDRFKISIKDFHKDHPLYKNCNLIELVNCKDASKTKFVMKVKQIHDHYVVAAAFPEFYESFNSKNVYNIRFRTNNYPFRCSHYALSLINRYNMTAYLFPVKNNNSSLSLPYTEKIWCNKEISNNPEQKQAILNIVGKSSFPAPYILYGPPGTGKTSTIVEAVCQIYHETSKNVLICTPSNTAADVITKRLLNYIPTNRLGRMYSQSRDISLIDDEIKKCSNCVRGSLIKVDEKFLLFKRVVICTLCTCLKLIFLNLTISFSYVFIDEAGQSTEPESLIAFSAISRHGESKCQIVLSGDPQQLGPGIRSKYATPILGQSLLERLMKLEPYTKGIDNKYDPRYITKLLRNYRSHPAIIRVSNELYYDNELIACNDKDTLISKEFPAGFPVIFHSIHGKEEKDNNSASSYNDAEIKKCLEYVHLLIGEKIGSKVIETKDIGILTPFTLQSNYLQKTLKQEHLEDVTVGTVEIFQGQEKEVIILSTVRSKTFLYEDREHIGFLSNRRRFNVALTRAKAILVVVGDPDALQIDKNWRHFLKFCQNNNACRGTEFQFTKDLVQLDSDDDTQARVVEHSIDFFPETFQILSIDDGIIRYKRGTNKSLPFEDLHGSNENCVIL